MMKRSIFILLALVAVLAVRANDVTVSIDGAPDAALQHKIESSISKILTEVNAAQSANRNLNASAMGLTGRVSESMAMLWENTHFYCADEDIVEHCITTGTGYQVRNIPLFIEPTDGTPIDDDEKYQEAVIGFDKRGNVESFYLTISNNLYMNVIRSNLELTDLRRRQLILDYVEQFRTAYNQKDIPFLDQVFSDNALIITGKVITQKKGDGITSTRVSYSKQTKQEYLSKLKTIFQSVKYVKVTFDEIEVSCHPFNKNIYGVTLHQGYSTNRYNDEGYVFLLWDFTDEGHPQIHVRTWQPTKINGSPIALPKDSVFSLADFDID